MHTSSTSTLNYRLTIEEHKWSLSITWVLPVLVLQTLTISYRRSQMNVIDNLWAPSIAASIVSYWKPPLSTTYTISPPQFNHIPALPPHLPCPHSHVSSPMFPHRGRSIVAPSSGTRWAAPSVYRLDRICCPPAGTVCSHRFSPAIFVLYTLATRKREGSMSN